MFSCISLNYEICNRIWLKVNKLASPEKQQLASDNVYSVVFTLNVSSMLSLGCILI